MIGEAADTDADSEDCQDATPSGSGFQQAERDITSSSVRGQCMLRNQLNPLTALADRPACGSFRTPTSSAWLGVLADREEYMAH